MSLGRWAACIVCALCSPLLMALSHPLDALSANEYREVQRLLQQRGITGAETVYARVHLAEPPKAEVLAWEPGLPFRREARAVLLDRDRVREVLVDLRASEVLAERELKGVQPGITFADTATAERVTRRHVPWRNAMRARGFANPDSDDIACLSLSAGYFADPALAGRRLLRVECYALAEVTGNVYQRPVGQLSAVVDVGAGQVVRLHDGGASSVVPARTPASDYPTDTPPAPPSWLRPVISKQPGGPSFHINNSIVNWGPWRFHLRLDRQRGTIVSLLRHTHEGETRSVLYQASLSEMFVPYMDPTGGWYYKTFFDVGEFGFGLMATPLVEGVDCPAHATLLGGVMAFDRADPVAYDGAMCLFERPTFTPAWRHRENINDSYAGMAGVELVIRMASAVGNYDYIFDWVLMPSGAIRVDIASTGIDNVKPVATRHMDDATAAADTRYGRLVAPNLLAVYHDHFFALRFDLDVDGTANTFVKDRIVAKRADDDSPRRNYWTIEPEAASSELQGTATIDISRPVQWRIEGQRRNAVGNPSSYVIAPAGNAISLLSGDGWPQRRAGFTDHHLWVTRHHPDELFAAGEFPNQSRGGDGLPTFVGNDEAIERADLVAWYTLGFHHVTASEDWPVLPSHKASVLLKPHNFFDRNPTIGRGPAAE